MVNKITDLKGLLQISDSPNIISRAKAISCKAPSLMGMAGPIQDVKVSVMGSMI
jgi:hypothetical protein